MSDTEEKTTFDRHVDSVKYAHTKWIEKKLWAEQLLEKSFDLEDASEILSAEYRDIDRIPETDWKMCVHGIGVNIYKDHVEADCEFFNLDGFDIDIDADGIDFDFGRDHPDWWRLKRFIEKQAEAGNNVCADHKSIIDDFDYMISVMTVAGIEVDDCGQYID